jgi:peptidoglycan-associated lipoprotein
MHRWSLCLALVVLACSSEKKAPTTPTAPPVVEANRGSSDATAPAPQPASSATEAVPEPMPKLHFGPVYFAFDDALLSEEARAELQRAGDFLNAHADLRVLLTGNTDERGTDEYNVALGDERARVCRDFLSRLGVDAERIRTLSYGEARPAVSESNEAAWTKNRRVELELSR